MICGGNVTPDGPPGGQIRAAAVMPQPVFAHHKSYCARCPCPRRLRSFVQLVQVFWLEDHNPGSAFPDALQWHMWRRDSLLTAAGTAQGSHLFPF